MPGFDGNGPMGAGPMTGGARGYCNGTNAGYGRGMGFGRGFRNRPSIGRGMRRGYGGQNMPYPPTYARTPEDELNILKQEADAVSQTLNTLHKRIADLEKTE